MITIAHVAGSAEWAGGERQLMDLITHLDPRKFRAAVVCPENGPLVERLTDRGIDARVVELAPLINPMAARALAICLGELSPDIVQSHGARSNFYARLVSGWRGWKHISTVHNAIQDYPVSLARRWIYSEMDKFSSRWSTSIVCVSDSLRKSLLSEGIRSEKIKVIPNGIDFGGFDPLRKDLKDLRSKWGKDNLLVGVVGRMTEQKGHVYLLKALQKLTQQLPSIRAVFIGDGPLREFLAGECGRLGISDRVIFAGVLQDMASAYAALDMIALPSLSEGMPYVMLEAMAMGRPVVASSVNGVPEAADNEKEALLVPPRDSDALVNAVISLHNNKESARRMAERGRERVLRDFSLQAMVDRWSNLYAEVAGRATKAASGDSLPQRAGRIGAV